MTIDVGMIPVMLFVASSAVFDAAPHPPIADAVASAPAGRVVRLDEATEQARKTQPAVVQARASTRVVSGRADEARAGLLPQIVGTAVYQHGYGPAGATAASAAAGVGTTVVTPVGSSAGIYDRFSFGGTATQLLWDFGQTYQRYRAASRNVDAFQLSERSAEIVAVLAVRRAFFQARAQKALIVVARDTLVNQGKHVEQIQGFVAVGTRPEIDLVQAKTDFANARLLLINAQNSYDVSKAQLAQAMGAALDGDFDVADDELAPVTGEDLPTERLVGTAMVQRPELASLEREREAQELTVKSSEGGYGPSVSAFAGASETGPSLDALGPAWNVGASLTWPIFQGGLTRGLVREAEANLDVTSAQIESERLQVRLDVQQALLAIRGAKAALGATDDALANARERLRLADGRYTSGVGSIIELGDAQIAVTNAAAQSVQAKFAVSTARAQLLAAIGRR